MGKPTSYVMLTVLKSQAEAVELCIQNGPYGNEVDTQDEHEDTITFHFDSVPYGDLEFLPNLVIAGIAYDSHWSGDLEYGEGTEHARFTPEGNLVLMSVYEEAINPPLEDLLRRIEDYTALKEYVLTYAAKVTPLPLDPQQEINGKLYLATQLIAPDSQ